MSRTNQQSGVERKKKRHCHYPYISLASFSNPSKAVIFYSWSAWDNRGDLLGLNFRLQFRGDIFWRTVQSWNKSFSWGWKIYTKSFWPGLRVAPISQTIFPQLFELHFLFHIVAYSSNGISFLCTLLVWIKWFDRLRWNSRDFILVI